MYHDNMRRNERKFCSRGNILHFAYTEESLPIKNYKSRLLLSFVLLMTNFESGGAQAIAAMAYGTETVPKVDKLCGPGNSFVTMAKMLVQNDSSASVSIDMPAGPSEVMVCTFINIA